MRTRAELEQIRTMNRARLGLAGVGAFSPFGGAFGNIDIGAITSGISGGVEGAVRRATIRTAFPSTETVWEPGREEPVEETGPGWGSWALAHVVRPEVEVETPLGMIRMAPYEKESDWSGFARAAAYGVGIGGALGVGWILFRAFLGGGR